MTSREEVADLFLKHFGAPEKAVIQTTDSYVNQYCNGLDDIADHPVAPNMSNVQTMPELVASFSSARNGKAPDLQGMRAELV
eukprot:4689736-Karenia_brevis.AAC.1